MSLEIKYDNVSKERVQSKLSTIEETLSSNITKLSNLYDEINVQEENPELANILTKVTSIKENKGTTRRCVAELNNKTGLNLEQITNLDSDISDTFGGW